MTVAVVLGGASGVWSELTLLESMLGRRADVVVACNDAGVMYPGRLDGWCTLHHEKFAGWRSRRHGNLDYRAFTIKHWPDCQDTELLAERWPGSSGLYAAQVALEAFDASRVVLCGVPLTMEGKHFFDRNNAWIDAENYRRGFEAALPAIRETVRSMSGWTRELLGGPTSEWLTNRAAART